MALPCFAKALLYVNSYHYVNEDVDGFFFVGGRLLRDGIDSFLKPSARRKVLPPGLAAHI